MKKQWNKSWNGWVKCRQKIKKCKKNEYVKWNVFFLLMKCKELRIECNVILFSFYINENENTQSELTTINKNKSKQENKMQMIREQNEYKYKFFFLFLRRKHKNKTHNKNKPKSKIKINWLFPVTAQKTCLWSVILSIRIPSWIEINRKCTVSECST